MNKNLLLIVLIAGVGTANYFLLRRSKEDIQRNINDLLPLKEKHSLDAVLSKMSRPELLDVERLFSMDIKENTPKSVTDKIDPAFKERLRRISNKYNIFT